jgi:hypothetical protein
MTEPSTKDQNPGSDGDGRIPRPAIWVVVFGLLISAIIYGISFLPGSGSLDVEWDTKEEIVAPEPMKVGKGTFGLGRTMISALAPNEEGMLLYRISGIARVDSGNQPTTVQCDVYTTSDDDSRIARSTSLRAAWPKPSDELQRQDVAETSYVKFTTGDTKKVELPIRDVVEMYTDSRAKTLVDWPGYNEDFQTWIWTMENGTGISAASMPWVVIFEAYDRPKGRIACSADVGRDSVKMTVPYELEEWPIKDDQPNADDIESDPDADTGDVSNVE